jgi:hypothetical protein
MFIGIDVLLVRLNAPIDFEVRNLPIYSGDTDDLIAETVTCAGYGATALGAVCATTADCESGQFCKWDICMTATDGPLRMGQFEIIPDPVDPDVWYRLLVPNPMGQMMLPGDSGSSCWNGSALTGVMKSGNTANYNRQTSGEVFHEWVDAVINPPVLKETNILGAACKSTDGALPTYTSSGQVRNSGLVGLQLLYPIRRPHASGFSNAVTAPKLFVVDRHPTQDICCQLQSSNPNGQIVTSAEQCSQGSSTGYQLLNLPLVYDNYSWSQFSVACSVPGTSNGAQSSVLTYRAKRAKR